MEAEPPIFTSSLDPACSFSMLCFDRVHVTPSLFFILCPNLPSPSLPSCAKRNTENVETSFGPDEAATNTSSSTRHLATHLCPFTSEQQLPSYTQLVGSYLSSIVFVGGFSRMVVYPPHAVSFDLSGFGQVGALLPTLPS